MIELLMYTTFWIWGINFAFRKDQVFYKISVILMQWLPKWVLKPLIGCCACMSSIHGSLSFFFFWDGNVFMYPIFIICLVGINHIITAFIYDLD